MKTNILTQSGHYFDYVDVESNVVTMADVSAGLSKECRFASQCPKFYSVAQHSVLVSLVVEALWGTLLEQRQALLHDASEAFMKDIPTPLKKLLPGYYEIEERVQRDLMRRFGVEYELTPLVRRADLIALAIEKRDLFGNSDDWLVLKDVDLTEQSIAKLGVKCPAKPDDARHMWELEYHRLFVVSTLRNEMA
jgi:uncharacterized protein